MLIPNIRTENPRRTVPMFFFFSDLENIRKTMPTSARKGVKEVGFKRLVKKLPPSIPLRDRIQAVTVVPRLAPSITLTACVSCMIPELTRPTTITVEADDD